MYAEQSKYPLEKLSNLCIITIGKTPSRNNPKFWGNGYAWAAISDINNSKYINNTEEQITKQAVDECNCRIVQEGTVLLSFKLSIGKVCINKIPLFTNEAIAALPILNNNKIDRDYLYWTLKAINITSNTDKAVKGLTLNKKKLQDILIPLPPLPKQKRIAEILDKADELRQKRKQAIALLGEYVKSIFYEMFGDPVKNEKGWEVKHIYEIADVSTGSTPSRKVLKYFDGEIPWVKTTEVNGKRILNTEERISTEGLNNSNCKLYPINTILIAMYGQGKTRGQSGILGIEATTNQACAAILPSEKYNPIFLFYYIQYSYDTLRNLGRGGNQPNLNLSMVKNFTILLPPLHHQCKFAELVLHVEQTKVKMGESLKEMDNLFNSLMQRAFKGEL